MKKIKDLVIRIKGEAIVVIVAFLLLFIGLEIAARIWMYCIIPVKQIERYLDVDMVDSAKFQYMSHPYICYVPRPNWRYEKLSHNSLGYRGKEFSLKKPKGTYRIVILGGSSTYDNPIMDNNKTTPVMMENYFKNELNQENIEVINAGAGGYNSWESLANLEFRILDLDPDLIIVYHGTNDVQSRFVPKHLYFSDNSGFRKAWNKPESFFWEKSVFLRVCIRSIGYAINNDNLKRRISLESFICTPNVKDAWSYNLGEKGIELLQDNPPVFFERNLRNMVAIAKAHDIAVMLTTWASTPHFENDFAGSEHFILAYNQHNELIKEVAKNMEVPLFDFEDVMSKEKKYWADGRHVNELGAKKKADLFSEFIVSENILTGDE